MKNLHTFIVNILIFFFVEELFNSILSIGGSFYERLVYASIFAGLMYTIPHILLFFKIPITEVSEFVIGSGLAFLFFFLGYYMFSFVDIKGYIFDPKIPVIEPVSLVDKSVALLIVGIVAAGLAVGIKMLNKKRKRSSSYSSY